MEEKAFAANTQNNGGVVTENSEAHTKGTTGNTMRTEKRPSQRDE